MEEREKSCGSTLAKILMIIGLATVVATTVTIICKKLADKKKAALAEADESTIDDYEECDFDCDECEDSCDCDCCCDAADDIAADEEEITE